MAWRMTWTKRGAAGLAVLRLWAPHLPASRSRLGAVQRWRGWCCGSAAPSPLSDLGIPSSSLQASLMYVAPTLSPASCPSFRLSHLPWGQSPQHKGGRAPGAAPRAQPCAPLPSALTLPLCPHAPGQEPHTMAERLGPAALRLLITPSLRKPCGGFAWRSSSAAAAASCFQAGG